MVLDGCRVATVGEGGAAAVALCSLVPIGISVAAAAAAGIDGQVVESGRLIGELLPPPPPPMPTVPDAELVQLKVAASLRTFGTSPDTAVRGE